MTLGDRVRTEREAKKPKWSQAELARRVSAILKRTVTQVAIHHIETRGAVNPRFVVELAQALGVTLQWLRTGRGPKHRASGDDAERALVPIQSYIGAGDEVVPIQGDDPIDWVPPPPGLEDGEATEVRGRSMLPHYRHGDRLFHRQIDSEPARYLGEVVAVQVRDGKRYIKVLERGSKKGLWNLTSINPAFPTLEDQRVEWIGPIEWVQKRHR